MNFITLKSRSCINLFKITDAKCPPTKLKLVLKGETKRSKGDTAGFYILQKDLINTYPHWKQKTSKCSLWFDFGNGNWKVGLTSTLGGSNCGIKGPFGEDDWPQNIPANWEYDDGTKWCVAESGDVVFEDLSNGNSKIQILKLCSLINSLFTNHLALQTRIAQLAEYGKKCWI